MLYPGSKRGSTDVYKTAVIDTIVAEVQSMLGEDRCVLLLGYKDRMEEMFQVRPTPPQFIALTLTGVRTRIQTPDLRGDLP